MRWPAALFMIAGASMLLSVALIGADRLGLAGISQTMIAPPAILAQLAGLLGLAGLLPRLAGQAPVFVRCAFAAIFAAAASLSAAGLWVAVHMTSAAGVPSPLPDWFALLAGLFILAMVLAYLFGALSALKSKDMLVVGLLLLSPVALMGLMFAAGVAFGFERAMSLDVYTNGLIAIALIAIGMRLRA